MNTYRYRFSVQSTAIVKIAAILFVLISHWFIAVLCPFAKQIKEQKYKNKKIVLMACCDSKQIDEIERLRNYVRACQCNCTGVQHRAIYRTMH